MAHDQKVDAGQQQLLHRIGRMQQPDQQRAFDVKQIFRVAKRLALIAANRSGISSAVARSHWRQQRLLVLCYHGVSQDDEHEWSDLYVSRGHFESRLDMLHDLGNVIPFDTAITALYDGSLPPRSVAITFDDGMRDFATVAAPLLSNASMHATAYVATYYCRKRLPVFDPFVSYLLWKARGRVVRVPGIRETLSIPMRTSDPLFQQLHARLLAYAYAQNLDADQKHEFSREIALAAGADFDSLIERRILQLMNAEEMHALDHNLVNVQLHTHRHRTPATLQALHEELADNAKEIVALTGRSDALSHFCYPSGVFSPSLTDWLDLHGVRSATTCEPGYAMRTGSRLSIPRYIDTMGVTADVFRARVAGTAALVQRPTRRAHAAVSSITLPALMPASAFGPRR